MLTTSRPLSQLMSLVLLVAALAGCGAAQLPPVALVAEEVAAGRAADAGAMLAATPDDLPAMRAALDLVLLAMPLAPADSALRDELDATQRSLLALLAVATRVQPWPRQTPHQLSSRRTLARSPIRHWPSSRCPQCNRQP